MHLDGYNQLPYLTGRQERSARKEFFYFNDDGDLVAMRYENWKVVFVEQRAPGTLRVWAEPFTPLRVPQALRPARRPLRARGRHVEHLLRLVHLPALPGLRGADGDGQVPDTFKEFPPRQRAASFSIDQMVEKMQQNLGGIRLGSMSGGH